MNPQVSFCEKIEELNESESHNTMQATQGNERDKPRFTFNIGQNLQEQMRTQLQQLPAAKDKHMAGERDIRADSLGSDSSNKKQIKEYNRDIYKLKKMIMLYF